MGKDYEKDDTVYMEAALKQAREACSCGEVPVGAVLVRGGEIVAFGRNRCEELKDPTAHAEILALREGGRILGGWRLEGCTLYVTLEPCAMCAGALVQARLARLVYGAADPKGGACGTLYNIVQDQRLNHRLAVTAGVLEAECAALLREFFKKRRG
ncbi:MAG: tRNA adenosine(34) deaminase TadA [Firmicutes bacterium]|nr:tRNA adenosine(34) deaminase TadA [Bacillota bacterium]